MPDPAQSGFEIGPERAGAHVGGERGLVHVDQAVERGEVERDAAEHRDGAAADAAPAGRWGDRDDGLVAGRQHGGDLRGGVRSHDHAGALGHGALGGPPDGQGPPVPAGFGPGGVVGRAPRRRSRPGGRAGRSGSVTTGAREPIGHGAAVRRRSGDRRGSGHGRSSPAVRSSFWQDSMKSVGLVGRLLLVPAQLGRDQRGRGLRGGHGRLGPLDHGPGPPGQHVVERLGHLLAAA